MNTEIYLRRLKVEDAEILYQWRNDPEIWKFTKFRPLAEITLDMETKWLKKVLTNKNEIRFAICLKEAGKYIGNVQLLNIEGGNAELHIFIGDKFWWGRGIGTTAVRDVLNIAFDELKLNSVSLEVHKENRKAKRIYKALGFKDLTHNKKQNTNLFMDMILHRKLYVKNVTS